MLIQLPYPSRPKSKHIGLVSLLALFVLLGFMLSFSRVEDANGKSSLLSPVMEEAQKGELSLLTYNVAGLPQLISSAETPRASSIREIGKQLNRFDLVNVQEDFNYNRQLYADNAHPYRTETMGGVPFGDGLSTLSKYPILETKRIAWEDCSGADCFTPKGFSYQRVQLAKDVFIDVYNVHATAQDNPEAVAARRKNILQLTKYIQEKSASQAILIMGDFNAHYAFSEDKLHDFQEQLGLSDSWVLLQNKGILPKHIKDFKALHALEVTEHCESIDKIFFRNSNRLQFQPSEYKIERNLFSTPEGTPLSDHCAVSMKMAWELL